MHVQYVQMHKDGQQYISRCEILSSYGLNENLPNFDDAFSPLQKGNDIFCALDVMDNMTFLEKLRFSITDKSLHYYLYNWMCPNLSPDKVQYCAVYSHHLS